MISVKAVNSPQANKERAFHVHMLVENVCILRENQVYNCSSASGLFLIFRQILGSCSYNIVLVNKKSVNTAFSLTSALSIHYLVFSSIYVL